MKWKSVNFPFKEKALKIEYLFIKRFRNYSWWCKKPPKPNKATNQTKQKAQQNSFNQCRLWMFRGERNLFPLGTKILLFIAIGAFLSVLMLQTVFWRERKLFWNSSVLPREGLRVFFSFPGLICLTEQCSLLLPLKYNTGVFPDSSGGEGEKGVASEKLFWYSWQSLLH